MVSSLRHRPRLGREIAVVLAVKFLALLVIWSLWFAHPDGPRLDAEAVGAALFSSPPVIQEGTDPHAQP